MRFCEHDFKNNYVATIGVDFKVKTIQVDDKRFKLQIWDTAGQERFKNITQTYYKGAVGIILAYSVTDENTFNNIGINQIMQRNGLIKSTRAPSQMSRRSLWLTKATCQKIERFPPKEGKNWPRSTEYRLWSAVRKLEIKSRRYFTFWVKVSNSSFKRTTTKWVCLGPRSQRETSNQIRERTVLVDKAI